MDRSTASTLKEYCNAFIIGILSESLKDTALATLTPFSGIDLLTAYRLNHTKNMTQKTFEFITPEFILKKQLTNTEDILNYMESVVDKHPEYSVYLKPVLKKYSETFNDKKENIFSDFENTLEILENIDVEDLIPDAIELKNSEAREIKEIASLITTHFYMLNSISYSTIVKDPIEYLKRVIFLFNPKTFDKEKGLEVHRMAENSILGRTYTVKEKFKEYDKSLHDMDELLRKKYEIPITSELYFSLPINKLRLFSDIEENITIKGYIDAVYSDTKRKTYLIVDWKTSTKYREFNCAQIELYRYAFASKFKIDVENIELAVVYFDSEGKQTKVEIVENHEENASLLRWYLNRLLSWKKEPNMFLENIIREAKPYDYIPNEVKKALS